MNQPSSARIVIVAGRDPSGAGLDADRAALAGLDVRAHYVATAHTDQDEHGVRSIGARDPRLWLVEALEAAGEGIDALKFGLLPGASHVAAAAELVRKLRTRGPLIVVVDPVLRASSGARFVDQAGIEALRGQLLVESVIVTPNLPETAELCTMPLARLERNPAARIEAAQILLGLGARAVIVKGGHGREDPVRDLVVAADVAPDSQARPVRAPQVRPIARPEPIAWIEHARIANGKIRGSGCRFATRLAARLAQGQPLVDAARDAANHVTAEIERSVRRL